MGEAARWREVDRLFEAALDLPSEARTRFLAEACAGDGALRATIERLLAADAAGSGDFLEVPVLAALATPTPATIEPASCLEERSAPVPGTRLGPYRLVEALQSGGMGTVYRAIRDDDQYQQQVAIKVLRAGRPDEETLHRFRVERQILARLEHPHIARLYDSGETEDGRPYLVMELIEGEAIDRYCDRRQLTLDERLALFRKVCGAVQHAHQSLLVHRDLKPSNILVTEDGTPKLLDFGISKQLDSARYGDVGTPGERADLTRPGTRMMTPGYASPEQVRGEAVTTASDVYALGVLLYELASGRSPYAFAGLPLYQVEEAICEREPERPSRAFDPQAEDAEEVARARGLQPKALRRRLEGDLDNIVGKALRKEPGQRYPSALALAQDVKAHLLDLPVVAQPDRLGYRLRRLMWRRRLTVAAAAILLLVTTGFVASLWLQERRLATERDKAQQVLEFLINTSVAANPYLRGDGNPTAQDLLTEGAGQAQRKLTHQPELLAALLDAFGQINGSFLRFDEADSLLRKALVLRERTLGAGSPEAAETRAHLQLVRQDRTAQAARTSSNEARQP